jgi:hypothetical protein
VGTTCQHRRIKGGIGDLPTQFSANLDLDLDTARGADMLRPEPVIELLPLGYMPTLIPPRFVPRFLCALPIATAAHAQAVVEYAAKSATGALSGSGSGVHLGACRVDSTLLTCARQFYPVTFQIVILAMCVFVGTLMFRKGRRV